MHTEHMELGELAKQPSASMHQCAQSPFTSSLCSQCGKPHHVLWRRHFSELCRLCVRTLVVVAVALRLCATMINDLDEYPNHQT